MTEKYIGIDVGGTEIKFALITKDGTILYSGSMPTQAQMGFQTSFNNIKKAINTILKENNISSQNINGIGIGLPGAIDNKNGIVEDMPNIPGWHNVPLAQEIKNEFGIITKLDNDANCAALGEYYFGAGKGCQHLVCITIGTGIGSGIINDGKLIRGFNNLAGEIGHIKTHIKETAICGCQDKGCLEAIAAGSAITELAKQTSFAKKYSKITPKIIFEEAQQNNTEATQIYKTIGEHIGTALASVINILNPQKIIIGGGIAKAGDILFNPIKDTINKRALKKATKDIEILPAQLGNNAGVMGASLLVTLK